MNKQAGAGESRCKVNEQTTVTLSNLEYHSRTQRIMTRHNQATIKDEKEKKVPKTVCYEQIMS